MKKIIAWALGLCLLMGCSAGQPQKCSRTWLDVFDTVSTVMAVGMEQAAFDRAAEEIHQKLLAYHQLFDIYHDYEGIANLKTVNDMAGKAPVQVDGAVIELLLACREYYDRTEGRVNVAMGSVLSLWHKAREEGILPDENALAEAARHTAMESLVIDEGASTIYLSDPLASLDVGAIAKGWACQRVAEEAPEGLLISLGGNVLATGPKADGSAWSVGVQDPADANQLIKTLSLREGAVVTSGDYQRFFTVEGKNYHHIIDPATNMPGSLWRSVTVICADSALADALSTALFLLPLEEGRALAKGCGAQALWVDEKGILYE